MFLLLPGSLLSISVDHTCASDDKVHTSLTSDAHCLLRALLEAPLAKNGCGKPLGDKKGHLGYQGGVQGGAAHGRILMERAVWTKADTEAMGFYQQ